MLGESMAFVFCAEAANATHWGCGLSHFRHSTLMPEAGNEARPLELLFAQVLLCHDTVRLVIDRVRVFLSVLTLSLWF
jgi:hypothetical protein